MFRVIISAFLDKEESAKLMKRESKALVAGAAEKLAAFVSACEWELTAEVVNGYLCDGFAELCRALNGFRTEKLVTPKVRPVASRLSHSVGSSVARLRLIARCRDSGRWMK